jgi:capsid protein
MSSFYQYLTIDYWLSRAGYAKGANVTVAQNEPVTDDDFERIDVDFARKVREIVRWMGVNNPDVASVVEMNKMGVIGKGVNIQSRVKDADDYNTSVEEFLSVWGGKGNCELSGRFHLNAAFRAMVEFTDKDGGFIVRHHANPLWPEFYRFEMLEIGLIDISKHDEEVNLINGMQRDSDGRVTALWLFKDADRMTSEAVSMDTLDFFSPVWVSLSQYTAVSKFASALPTIDKLDQYSDAELQAAVERAKAGKYWKTSLYDDIIQIVKNIQDSSVREQKLTELYTRISEQGVKPHGLTPIPLGDDIAKVDEPSASVYPNLTKNGQKNIAASQGISAQLAYQDSSDSNYSSIKAIMAFASIQWGIRFDDLEHGVIRPMLSRAIDAGVMAGRIDAPDDYWQNRGKYHKLELMRVVEIDIEPGKTATANAKRLETGEISLRELCARRGRDVRDIIHERLEDELYELNLRRELGLDDGESVSD